LFGKIKRCDVCGQGAQQAYLRKLCGLTGEALDWRFDEHTARNRTNAEVYDVALLLAQQPQQFLTLLGGFGVGKTRFLSCIVNTGREAGYKSVYTTTARLLDHLRSTYDNGASLKYDAMWELFTDAKILAIDEFDRWNPTPWAREKFEQLIDTRYQGKRDQLTVFAANAKVEDLPGYIASRMQDRSCYLFELTGQDVRRVVR
jgi:DNA replication protein DnaC